MPRPEAEKIPVTLVRRCRHCVKRLLWRTGHRIHGRSKGRFDGNVFFLRGGGCLVVFCLFLIVVSCSSENDMMMLPC